MADATQTASDVQVTSVPAGKNGKGRSKKGGKGRAPGTEYPVPEGNIRFTDGKFVEPNSWGTPFKYGVHNKLKLTDFADVLDYHQFNVWFNKMNLADAEADLKLTRSMGDTAEERNAAVEDMKLMKLLQRRAAERKSSGNSKSVSKLLEAMESTMASMVTG